MLQMVLLVHVELDVIADYNHIQMLCTVKVWCVKFNYMCYAFFMFLMGIA